MLGANFLTQTRWKRESRLNSQVDRSQRTELAVAETILKVIRVFIGSPGGLEMERQAAVRIVNQVNQSHAEHWGCQINLVGWEATLPGYSRAQSLINQDLDKCDYFIGVLWDHWGSPPDAADPQYTSGFEEEFERARSRIENGLMKDMALFFKEISEGKIKDPGPSLKQVLAFREKCVKARKPLFKQFKEAGDFESIFRAKIEDIGWQEYNALKAREKEVLDPEQPATGDKGASATPGTSPPFVGPSAASFVSEFLTRPADWDATKSHEIARLRLIALGAYRTGNDEMYLGNHDANLLFSQRTHYNFAEAEIRTLIDAGIVGFQHQNVPLWRWLAASSKKQTIFERAQILAAVGNEQEQPNAIRLLQCVGQGTPALDEVFDRRRVLRNWLAGEVADNVFSAALEFLKTNGDSDDLNILESMVAETPAKRRSALAETIVLMWTKADLSKAFEKLLELDPDTMGEASASTLFENSDWVSTAIAEKCMKLKSASIRRRAAMLLHARQAIGGSTAEALVADPDFEIRLVGVEALAQHGKALQEETIRSALTRPQTRGLFALGSGPPDDSHYQRYRQNRLSQLSEDELRKKVDGCTVFDELEVVTLYENYTRKCTAEIRANLADRFKGYFDRKLALTAALLQHDTSRLAEIKKLEGYIRNVLTSRTLDIFCAYTNGADLDLVRSTINDGDIAASKNILRFMGRHGDWTDVPRICRFINAGIPVQLTRFLYHQMSGLGLQRKRYTLSENCALLICFNRKSTTVSGAR